MHLIDIDGDHPMAITRRAALLGTAAAAGLTACAQNSPRVNASAALAAALDTIKKHVMPLSPEYCTSLALSEADAGGAYMSRLSDLSGPSLQQAAALTDTFVRDLASVPDKGLTPLEMVSKRVVLAAARFALPASTFGYGDFGFFGAPTPYIVTQLSGSYTSIPDFLDSQHPVENSASVDAYLARLTAFATQLNQETDRIKSDAKIGVVPPDFVLSGTLNQMKAFVEVSPAQTILVQSLVRRVKMVEPPLTKSAADYGADAAAIVQNIVYPAYRAQIAALEALQPNAPTEAGVWRLPKGDDFYKVALAAWTTTSRTPDDIHAIGLAQLQTIDAEMDKGLKELGFTEGSVGQRMAGLNEDPQYLYPNTDTEKEKLIADLGAQIAVIEKLLPRYFGRLPKAKVSVKRVPPYTEAGAPRGYYQRAALDGSRPGAYYINLRSTAEWPKYSLPTLTYHEAIPGHHLQIALSQEAGELHFVRRNLMQFSGFSEGWGLYAEQLADEIGLYANDPIGRLGYLQSAAYRATRLVVDTGIHAKKWTREKAIDFMQNATGESLSAVTTEIERYCVWPGQACASMLGKLEILDLRESAKTELGTTFDIKAFHDTVLLNGSVPLTVLREIVAAWIASVKAA